MNELWPGFALAIGWVLAGGLFILLACIFERREKRKKK